MGKFNVTFNCFCGQPIRMLVDSMQEILTLGPLGMVLNGVWENSDDIPVKIAHSYGDLDPI